MKKLLLILFFPPLLQAETAWVSDSLRTSVNQAAGLNKRFIATLNAGDEVQVLERSSDKEYVKVKKGDVVGWIASRNLMTTPSVHVQLAQQNALLADLQQKNNSLQSSEASNSQMLGSLQAEFDRLKLSEQKAREDLQALQRASSNIVAIDQRNRELEALIANAEQVNLTLRHRNDRLEEALHSHQIYVGGALVLIGFVLHWLLDHFRAINRNRSSYDDL